MQGITEIRKQNQVKRENASISGEARFAPLSNGGVLVNNSGRVKTLVGDAASAFLDRVRGKNANQQREVIQACFA